MYKFIFTTILIIACTFNSHAGENVLTLDSIIAGSYTKKSIPEMRPADNPTFYTVISDNRKMLCSYEYKTGKLNKVLIDLENVKGEKLKSIAGYIMDPSDKRILIWEETHHIYRRSFTTTYYVYDIKRNLIEKLSEKPGGQRDAKFSPDGRSIAFSRDNNLFIRRLDFGSELIVTEDGKPNSIINGVTDWVYEEEFGMTVAYDWSVDGTQLAFIKFDETAVPEFGFTLFGAFRNKNDKPSFYPGNYQFKYPSAGEKNSKVGLYIYQLQTRSSKKINLPIAEEDYIPQIKFTKNSNQLAVMTLNRSQDLFRMYFVNTKSAVPTLIITDKNEKYVDPVYESIKFYTDYFTYLSEKDGYRHLYLYSSGGVLKKQLTTGNWDVISYLGCDTLKNRFYYIAADEKPYKRNVYQIDLKGKKVKINTNSGVATGSFNSDYSLFVQRASDINTPEVVTVNDLSGKVLRVVENNDALKTKLKALNLPSKSFINVPAADGTPLNAWIIKPKDFNENKKYPLVQIQYSGPDAQSVLDEYKFEWEYYLAQKGFVVVCVDGRGTGGRGAEFRRKTFKKLGILEAEDQISAAKHFSSLGYIDSNRIAIWGWSYGGFITLMSMTSGSEVFKAGIAVAPVCDYRYYNTVYTERYMRTPGENKEGYDASSPLLRANKLKGNLLLIHGLADDNVRANQSLDFSEELIKAGIQFDTQFYPTSNHSILGKTYRSHLYKKMVNFLTDKL